MNIWKTAVVVAAGLCALSACQPAKQDTAADEASIRAVNAAWGVAYNAGDADAIAALYTEDAVVMPPGTPAITGRAAFREFIANDIAGSKAAGLTMNIAETGIVGVSGDLAWESGTFTVTDAAGASVDAGKFLSVFQKTEGKWLLVRDTWNSDNPPAPAPAAEPAAE